MAGFGEWPSATEQPQLAGAVKRQHLFEPAQRVSLLA